MENPWEVPWGHVCFGDCEAVCSEPAVPTMLLCTVLEMAALVSRLAWLGNTRSHPAEEGRWQDNGPAQLKGSPT